MSERTLVFDPVAQCHNKPQPLRNSLHGLTDKVVGFIDNAKPNFNHLVDDLAELLIGKYGIAAVIKRRKRGSVPVSDAVMKELAEHCDAVITGSGD